MRLKLHELGTTLKRYGPGAQRVHTGSQDCFASLPSPASERLAAKLSISKEIMPGKEGPKQYICRPRLNNLAS